MEDKTHVDHPEEIGLHRKDSAVKGPRYESHVENREEPVRDFHENKCLPSSELVVGLHEYTK
jgi:hypothetical protein